MPVATTGAGAPAGGVVSQLAALLGPTASFWLPGPQYFFSDAAGTVPCADTDMIRVWRDASGNGITLQQDTSGLRPVARLINSKWRAVFDGVDDFLPRVGTGAYAANNELTLITAHVWSGTTTGVIAGNGGSTGVWLRIFANDPIGGGGVLYESVININFDTATVNLNNPKTFALRRTATTLRVWDTGSLRLDMGAGSPGTASPTPGISFGNGGNLITKEYTGGIFAVAMAPPTVSDANIVTAMSLLGGFLP